MLQAPGETLAGMPADKYTAGSIQRLSVFFKKHLYGQKELVRRTPVKPHISVRGVTLWNGFSRKLRIKCNDSIIRSYLLK